MANSLCIAPRPDRLAEPSRFGDEPWCTQRGAFPVQVLGALVPFLLELGVVSGGRVGSGFVASSAGTWYELAAGLRAVAQRDCGKRAATSSDSRPGSGQRSCSGHGLSRQNFVI